MGLREQIAAAVSQIRNSRYGRDVRSGIADGIEKTVELMTVEAIRTYKGTSEPSTDAAAYDGIKLNDRYLKMSNEYDSETETGTVEKQFYCSAIEKNQAGSPIHVEWEQMVTEDSIPQGISRYYEVEVNSTNMNPPTNLSNYPEIKEYDICYTWLNAGGTKVIRGMYIARLGSSTVDWIRIPLGLDTVVQNTNNAVQNYAIKNYVDNAIAELKTYVDEHIGG